MLYLIDTMTDSRYRTTDQIRAEFLEFFQEKGHTIVPSSSMVPHDDPTLLFINAGMNQFKDVFLGTGTRPYHRAADAQKCLRVSGKHNDLEEVGHDTYHHTFFEMLGNWSFGDYFKDEAIAWTWELLHTRWGISADRLYATVHEGDDALGLPPDEDAATLWRRHMPDDRVLFGSSKDNFWMMGDTGPCGPCSEVHIDLRSDTERARVLGARLINQDHPLVIEIWNLVFIQFNAVRDRPLEPLAACHVDTGMGLERLAAVIQGKSSTYDTDAFAPLLAHIARLTAAPGVQGYDEIDGAADRRKIRIAMRVVADHIRAIVFAIADGAVPGNVGQGYVIRRILRRAVRYGYTFLHIRKPFLWHLAATVIAQLDDFYRELREHESRIQATIRGEETAFLRTLGRGLELSTQANRTIRRIRSTDGADMHIRGGRMQDLIGKAYPGQRDGDRDFIASARQGRVSGNVAFLLHDTYGFPVDLTQLIAREHGHDVDMEQYHALMARQKARAREASGFRHDQKAGPAVLVPGDNGGARQGSIFAGHDVHVVAEARVVGIDPARRAVILDRTPFYAENGGQVGDTGVLQIGSRSLQVIDTQVQGDQVLHLLDEDPAVQVGATVRAAVDVQRRRRIAKHHTATHLMHAALREVLGPGVAQKGSLVAPGHLRFDFNHYDRVGLEDIRRVQSVVNSRIQENITAQIDDAVPYADALDRGATALFGEKYGDFVRVVTFDPGFSVELCGGTHVQATGELGLFVLQSEGSVAAGIRRVEAVAGLDALAFVEGEHDELDRTRKQFKGQQREVDALVAKLLEDNKKLRREVAQLRRDQLTASLDIFVRQARRIGPVQLITGRVPNSDMKMLRQLGKELSQRIRSSAVGVIGTTDPDAGKAYLVAVVSDDLVATGMHAGRIVGQLARRIGGGGGGAPELASAGGRKPEHLDQALEAVGQIVASMQQNTQD